MTVTTQTSCKPNARCAQCRDGWRRFVETNGKEHHFFHYHYAGDFQDCEDQTYERVTFGAYENKVKA